MGEVMFVGEGNKISSLWIAMVEGGSLSSGSSPNPEVFTVIFSPAAGAPWAQVSLQRPATAMHQDFYSYVDIQWLFVFFSVCTDKTSKRVDTKSGNAVSQIGSLVRYCFRYIISLHLPYPFQRAFSANSQW